MKSFKEITAEFEKKITTHNKQIEEESSKVIHFEKKVAECQKNVDMAQLSNDLETYQKERENLQMAKWGEEMHRKNLNELKNKPLVDRQEFEKYIEEIDLAYKQQEKNLVENCFNYSKKLKELSDQSYQNLTERSQLLDTLEYELGKNNEEYKKGKYGSIERFFALSYYDTKIFRASQLYENMMRQVPEDIKEEYKK